jgi:hypothetical protein
MTGEFSQKFTHGRDHNPQAGQRPHGRTDHRGINALGVGVSGAGLHEGIRDAPKQPFLQPMGDHNPTVVTQCPFTDRDIRSRWEREGIMPSQVKGDRFDGRRICAVMELL